MYIGYKKRSRKTPFFYLNITAHSRGILLPMGSVMRRICSVASPLPSFCAATQCRADALEQFSVRRLQHLLFACHAICSHLKSHHHLRYGIHLAPLDALCYVVAETRLLAIHLEPSLSVVTQRYEDYSICCILTILRYCRLVGRQQLVRYDIFGIDGSHLLLIHALTINYIYR